MAASDSTRAPAFQFYPKDFLSDENVRVMSLQERGAYITLISLCWIEGSLPDNQERLARLCGVPLAAFRRLWPAMAMCFRAGRAGRLIHPRLEKELAKQRDYRRRQSDRGKASGEARRNRARTRHEPEANAGSTSVQPSAVEPKPNSSVCNLQSSDSSQTVRQERVPSSRAREPLEGTGTDAEAERAGRFIDRYEQLYQKHRKGARYVRHPQRDYAEALTLVRTWDDDRLDKIATVFLTTDHPFAEQGSRTIGQLRSMASWCDGRLTEAGL